jgi:hypothetical protein
VAAALAYTVRLLYARSLSPLLGLMLETTMLLATFTGLLLFATGQKALYLDLFRLATNRAPAQESTLASV